ADRTQFPRNPLGLGHKETPPVARTFQRDGATGRRQVQELDVREFQRSFDRAEYLETPILLAELRYRKVIAHIKPIVGGQKAVERVEGKLKVVRLLLADNQRNFLISGSRQAAAPGKSAQRKR